jgi:hypothetical protein
VWVWVWVWWVWVWVGGCAREAVVMRVRTLRHSFPHDHDSFTSVRAILVRDPGD